MVALARACGFEAADHVSPATLFFGGRPDGPRPSSSEAMLVAKT
jgi:hypothetical protein